ncbi:cell division protein FtsK [Amycolatopsis sp. WAC 04197]|uniref:cell division protein FtsK n=1 Tax=Amycolatopsis sp. WAC 04197 TaxID=2203199 RepID=UPI000F79568A|nr:cell division protein FtsK [Amycolatopsis sp. WAC 04197]RSN40055.1 cell division protein FtsK [Amycolatopsis sp. WAC 04197]
MMGEPSRDPDEQNTETLPVPVDPDNDTETGPGRHRRGQRRPIIAPWLHSYATARAAVASRLGFYWHITLFHLTRVPLYVVRLAGRSPRGLSRVTLAASRWILHTESRSLRRSALEAAETEQYLKIMRDHDRRVRLRVLLALGLLLVAGTGFAVLLAQCPVWTQYAVVASLVGALGWVGSPADAPIVGSATVETRYVRLTSDAVTRALLSLGIGGMKDAAAIGFPAPITRDGLGWRADIDLPPGITAADVIERRAKLASALSRPLGCVWPEAAPGIHPGRLVLWVADQDMATTRKPVWPLAKSGVVDLFAAQPFGTDPRGRWVHVTLMFASVIIGALPRIGKTVALRLLLLVAALDVRAQLHVYDLKGTGDLDALRAVAHRYRAGDDDDDIAYALDDMRALSRDLVRRAKVIRGLPRDLAPENKITPALAGNSRLGLHPVVIGVDECQRWFEHPEHGAEFASICEDLVRRGPAVGIMLLLATQRPTSKSIPTDISSNAIIRFALKVLGQVENDVILGTSAYRNGNRATLFSRRDLGIGLLVGEDDDTRTVHVSYVTRAQADAITARARALRETAGRLSGYAADEDPTPAEHERPGSSLLPDLLTAFRGEARAWSETLTGALAELRPDAYTGWGPAQLSAALRPYGVRSRQVWGTDPVSCEGANRRGFQLADVRAALDAQKGGSG